MYLCFQNSNEMISTQGEIGELCVRGVGVALGYYGDFERSKEVFVQNPLNNVYEGKSIARVI